MSVVKLEEELQKNPSLKKIFEKRDKLLKEIQKHANDRKWWQKNGAKAMEWLYWFHVIFGEEGWTETR